VFAALAGEARVRHEHVGITQVAGDQALNLLYFIREVRRPKDVAAPARELALDDESSGEVFLFVPLPGPGECAVSSPVAGI
jgi:hypothetical protein